MEQKPASVPMYNPQQLKFNHLKKPATQKKGAGFIPVEDGFITTAGNAERGAKWGNIVLPLTEGQVKNTCPFGNPLK